MEFRNFILAANAGAAIKIEIRATRDLRLLDNCFGFTQSLTENAAHSKRAQFIVRGFYQSPMFWFLVTWSR